MLVVCAQCQHPGTLPEPIVDENGEVQYVDLCQMHSDPLRILRGLISGAEPHRYANPGRRPMTRRHVIARDDITPLDWMTPLEPA